jgi:hypothetical protein
MWALYIQAWQQETLEKFETIGKPNDQCDDYLMSFESSYGMWKVVKARSHTSGAVNLSNEAIKLTFLGGERCQTPADWQVIESHGDKNSSLFHSIIIVTISTSIFHISIINLIQPIFFLMASLNSWGLASFDLLPGVALIHMVSVIIIPGIRGSNNMKTS